MKITRRSILTGISRTMDLPITLEQVDKYIRGAFIQDAFPHLNDDDREFIKSGITAQEWEETCGRDTESCFQ